MLRKERIGGEFEKFILCKKKDLNKRLNSSNQKGTRDIFWIMRVKFSCIGLVVKEKEKSSKKMLCLIGNIFFSWTDLKQHSKISKIFTYSIY